MGHHSSKRAGFTLVELLVVVAILGALALIAIPRMTGAAERAKRQACLLNIKLMNAQLELYYANELAYPESLSVVTSNPDYFPDGNPVCPFNVPYSNGLLNNRVDINNHNH